MSRTLRRPRHRPASDVRSHGLPLHQTRPRAHRVDAGDGPRAAGVGQDRRLSPDEPDRTGRSERSRLDSALRHGVAVGLLALCEATLLTALRTGAASAARHRHPRHPTASTTLGIIGCGAQAVTQIHAISRVRPIDRVVGFDVDPTSRRASRRGCQSPTIGVRVGRCRKRLGGLVARVRHRLHRDHRRHRRPAGPPDVTIGHGSTSTRSVRTSRANGRYQRRCFSGRWWFPTSPTMPEGRRVPGARRRETRPRLRLARQGHAADHHPLRDRLTVFDSTGWALEDLLAAEIVLAHAQRIGAGESIDLQPIPRDPYDPYEFVRR